MGIFNNLFGQRLADPKLPTFHELSSDTYPDFTERNEFSVILFDAPWDVGGAKALRPRMQSAVQTYRDRVQFGEVDIDKHQDIPSSIQLRSIPAVAYYRKGKLIELVSGQTQDMPARIEALLGGPK